MMKITTSAGRAARYDTYLQDDTPMFYPGEAQGGKRWYDTDKVSITTSGMTD